MPSHHPLANRRAGLVLAAFLVMVSVALAPLGRGQSAPPTATAGEAAPAGTPAVRTAASDASARLDPRLAAAIDAASGEGGAGASADATLAAVAAEGSGLDARVHVVIQSAGAIDLDGLADKTVSTAWPMGQRVTLARVPLGALMKVAALPNVAYVEDAAHPVMADDRAIDPDRGAVPPGPVDGRTFDDLVARDVPFSAAPPLAVLADRTADRGVAGDAGSRDPAGTDAWFDERTLRSAEAWQRGWTGQGVTVGVADTGVDFVTPELVGTWATIDDPGSPYFGWPQALDAAGLYQYVQDVQMGTKLTEIGAAGHLRMTQESPGTPEASGDFTTTCFKRVRRANASAPIQMDTDPTCTYRVPRTSQGGVYRFGVHPDPSLLARYNERPGVLLVDEATAGVFDTVYVDLDNDRDFAEEKPVTRADPLAYRDLDGNGWADLSGGLLYWISDGLTVPPGGWLWGALTPVPEQGRLVAFLGPFGGSHGTLCASNVAAQGVLPVPEGVDLRFRDLPGDGRPPYLVKGAAPGAKVVAIYRGGVITTESAYVYATAGHDKDRPGDEVQVLSNSYPLRDVWNEGWDNASRLIDSLAETSPNLTFVFSTGNGGPGYGSLRDPHPRSAIKVAASTQRGSTGWGSITDTKQILWGDIIPYSSMGPGSDGTIGPHVAADGADATGATIVNRFSGVNLIDSRRTVVTWNGTSRATPVTAGHVALVYQAFRGRHGRWPTWSESRAILMAGAFQNGYDPYMTGAGVVDGGRSSLIAGGVDGLYAMPAVLNPGDYRGQVYDAFPRLVKPGDERSATLTLYNPSDRAIDVRVAARQLKRIGHASLPWTSGDVQLETRFHTDMPDYLVPLDLDDVPAGAELMVVRALAPWEDIDLGLDYRVCASVNVLGNCPEVDNRWRLSVQQHTDINGDGLLWHDRDGDGVVDKAVLATSHQIDGEPDIDWVTTELDRWEFQSFTEDYRTTNNLTVLVHHPRERWGGGLYLGLHHAGRPASRRTTTFQIEIEFYGYQDWDWVKPTRDTLSVPARGKADVALRVAIPENAPYGYAQGNVFVTYAWRTVMGSDVTDGGRRLFLPAALADHAVTPTAHPTAGVSPARGGGAPGVVHAVGESVRLNVPVQLNVVAVPGDGGAHLVGEASRDPDLPYANGLVRGQEVWGYGDESGDWRFFPVDMPDDLEDGLRLVLRSTWEDGVARGADGQTRPRSDIDTLVFGPATDRWTDPRHPGNAEEDVANPALFGPQALAQVGGSAYARLSAGVWPFETATGGYEEWVTAPVSPGLHVVMAHSELISGDRAAVPLDLSLDRAVVLPETLVGTGAGCQAVTFRPGFALPDIDVRGVGPSPTERFATQVVQQDTPTDQLTASWRRAFDVEDGAWIDIVLDGADGTDMDLYLYRDADGDGQPAAGEQVASSGTSTPDEHIRYENPIDGTYLVTVHGWKVPDGSATFDLDLLAVQGRHVTSRGLPTSGVSPGQTVTFDVCYEVPPDAAPGTYEGFFSFGPAKVPGLLGLPVRVTVP
jgi:hypothetical protein